jgi:hypothetical protein
VTDVVEAIWVKDPGDYADYEFLWGDWVRPGDGIISATITISGKDTNLTHDAGDDTHTDDVVTVWLGAGTEGVTYHLACQVVTASGRIATRYVWVEVKKVYCYTEGAA